MANSKIPWTGSTLNPITGCTPISPGCKNCYAMRMTKRLAGMRKQKKYKNGMTITCHPDVLDSPLNNKKSKTYFVGSMSDIFHYKVPSSFCADIFEMMNKANIHNFQLLTKRSGRLLELNDEFYWSPNIWMGVSVENDDYLYRIDNLRATDAFIKFLSIEPLLGPLPGMDLSGIDWVITGGESGPGARPMKKEWVVDIKSQCIAQKTRFFFKQWGGNEKHKGLPMLDGRTWSQMPIVKDFKPKLFA